MCPPDRMSRAADESPHVCVRRRVASPTFFAGASQRLLVGGSAGRRGRRGRFLVRTYGVHGRDTGIDRSLHPSDALAVRLLVMHWWACWALSKIFFEMYSNRNIKEYKILGPLLLWALGGRTRSPYARSGPEYFLTFFHVTTARTGKCIQICVGKHGTKI